MKISPGQSLMEYSLVMGLVALACIGGVAVLATSIQKNMTEAVAQDSAPINNNPTVVSQNLAAPNTLVAAGQANTRQSGNNSLPVENLCLSGICANFPIVNAQNDLVDVAAGEGADRLHQFSNTLNELAESIENMPDPDSALAEIIRDLAKSGHQMGDAQSKLIQYKGNGYGMPPGYLDHINGERTLNENYAKLTQYIEAHPNLATSGLVSIIQSQVGQIQTLSKGFTFQNHSRGAMPSVSSGKNAPKLTHQSSNTICRQQDRSTCIRSVN